MKHLAVLSLVLVTLSLGGCACHPCKPWHLPCKWKSTSRGAQYPVQGTPRNGWLQCTGLSGGLTRVNGDLPPPVPFPLYTGDHIETNEFMKIEVWDPSDQTDPYDRDYKGVLSPYQGSDKLAVGIITQDGEIEVHQGWLFLWGNWPIVPTPWIHAISRGTTMVVEIATDSDGVEVHRIYFLRQTEDTSGDGIPDEKVQVYCPPDVASPIKELEKPCFYVEIRTGCNPKGPIEIKTSPQEEFIKNISLFVGGLGWNEPGPECDD